jgi:hypothetical protein
LLDILSDNMNNCHEVNSLEFEITW